MGLSKKQFLSYKLNDFQEESFLRDRLLGSSSEKHHEFVSSTLLLFKICFFILGTISLIKIGYISKIRITRLKEIRNSYTYEKDQYTDLTNRFDDLFSFNGQQRFMKDQDQMISVDIIRVIWR